MRNKMPKGKKSCPKCQTSHALRTKECGCGHIFYVTLKNTKKIGSAVSDWRELQPDQIIRVVNSDKIRGKFQIKELDRDGIHSYNVTRGHYQYIYMGKERRDKFGQVLTPNKVRLLNDDLSRDTRKSSKK